jgi:hypothetical protein
MSIFAFFTFSGGTCDITKFLSVEIAPKMCRPVTDQPAQRDTQPAKQSPSTLDCVREEIESANPRQRSSKVFFISRTHRLSYGLIRPI